MSRGQVAGDCASWMRINQALRTFQVSLSCVYLIPLTTLKKWNKTTNTKFIFLYSVSFFFIFIFILYLLNLFKLIANFLFVFFFPSLAIFCWGRKQYNVSFIKERSNETKPTNQTEKNNQPYAFE